MKSTPTTASNWRTEAQKLLVWYRENHRQLPWRQNRDPYRIWISETMLQQTTTTAVIPYYERFLKKFPTLPALARAPLNQVLAAWAGLGYYSRARNLHKAAQALAKMAPNFPKTYAELMELPGFGPYTARAVSSLAFSEPVGVLDGNVIRILSRKYNLALEWWRPKPRAELQKIADALASTGPSHEINQAMMELGALICSPKNPQCVMCPWIKSCQAKQAGTIHERPLKKEKRKTELWLWSPQVHLRSGQVLLTENHYAPFLRSHWILPGTAQQVPVQPKNFHFRHMITHHAIFAQVLEKKSKNRPNKKSDNAMWVELEKLPQYAPASLIKKAIEYAKK